MNIDQATLRSQDGLANITFDTKADLASAIKALKNSILEGRPLEIKTILSGDYNTNTSIFISGVH